MATTLEPVPGTDPTEMVDKVNRAFEQLSKAVPQAKTAVAGLTGSIKFSPFMLSPAATLWIRKSLTTIHDGLDKVVGLASYAANHQIPVVSLIVQSFHWVTDVKAPMSTMSGQATNAKWTTNENLGDWTGKAADLYRAKATVQGDAMAAVTGKAEFISQWLFTIARANVDFMVKLAEIAIDFVTAVAKATFDAVGVITLPKSLDTIAGAVAKIVNDGLKVLVRFANDFINTMQNVLEIENNKADQAVLPGGNWPQAVHDSLVSRLGPGGHPGF